MKMLYVKKLHKNAVIPKYQHKGDVGFDLSSVEDYNIKPGESQMVKTGLSIKLPYGYEMTVRQRSGLSITYPNYIMIGIGTVDTDYIGEIMIPIINNRRDDKNFVIKIGDRIAQGIISPVLILEIYEVDELVPTDKGFMITKNSTKRGTSGFGSTGL